MKKSILIFTVAIILVAGFALLALARISAYGREITATTTTARIADLSLDWISVVVDTGQTNTAYFLPDVTTNAFNTALAAGEAVALKGGESHMWPAAPKTVITSICYSTTNGTASFRISGAEAITLE